MAIESHSVQFAGGNLGGQRHICAFFNSIDEEHRVLRSFIKEGLERGEKAFHVVDPELREKHLKLLAEAGINVHQAIDTGQLEVRRWQDAYLRGDHFDQNAMLALIEEVLQSADTAGYPLTRLVAHMEWALFDKPGGVGGKRTAYHRRRARRCAGWIAESGFCFCAFVRSPRGRCDRSHAGTRMESISGMAANSPGRRPVFA